MTGTLMKVLSTGPPVPQLMMKLRAKGSKAPITCNTRFKKVIGISSGMVMCRKRRSICSPTRGLVGESGRQGPLDSKMLFVTNSRTSDGGLGDNPAGCERPGRPTCRAARDADRLTSSPTKR